MHDYPCATSRRRRGAAVVAAVGCLVLAACGSNDTATSSSDGGNGTLTVSLPAAPQSLNPGVDGNGGQNIVQWLAYEPLIRRNADGSYTPGLATSWGYVGTGNTTFQMESAPTPSSLTAPPSPPRASSTPSSTTWRTPDHSAIT